jgi:hypothetical protein
MTLFVEIADKDFCDPQLDAGPLPDERVIPANKLHQATANRSAPQQSDFQSTIHG